MLSYLIQMIACSGVLYGYYHFFLRNERFHQYNRFYLLTALLFSLLVPLLKIPVWFKTENPVLYNLGKIYMSEGENITVGATQRPVINLEQALWAIAVSITLFLAIRLFMAIQKIRRIKNEGVVIPIDNVNFIETADPDAPFSFFRWLFWNNKIKLNSTDGEQIFRHEMYHVQQCHSIDVLFTELLLCLFWFNPFLYLYRKEIKAIQEFLADQYAVSGHDQYDYASLLVIQSMSAGHTQLVNPFFHNQLKRRITMLTTSKKPAYQYLRKMMVLPIAAVVFMLFAFTYKKAVTPDANRANQKVTNAIVSNADPSNTAATQPPTIVESKTKTVGSIDAKVSTTPKEVANILPAYRDTTYFLNGHKITKAEFKKITSTNYNIQSVTVLKDEGKVMVSTITKERTDVADSKPKVRNDEMVVTGFQREPEIFTKVEHEAEFPGDWRRYLETNLDGTAGTKHGAPAGNYQVIIQFIVNHDGTVRDVKALTKQGYGMEDEAIRVIKRSGKWKPATQNGREVNAYRKQPITFSIQK